MTVSPSNICRRVLRSLHEFEKWTLVFLALCVAGFALLQVVLRNFFSTGFAWGDTLQRHLVLWLSLLGAARATLEDKHIQVLLLPVLLPPKAARFLPYLSDGFSFAVSAVLFYASWTFVENERSAGDFAFLNIPYWWIEVIFPISFGIMGVRFGWRPVHRLCSRNGDSS